MKGLEVIAGNVAKRLLDEDCVTSDHQLKQGPATTAILEAYPIWLLAYSVEPFKAIYINSRFADFLQVPAGFLKTEDEYRTVHNCDITTSYNRFQTFEYFLYGGAEKKEHVATILSPTDAPVFVNDLAYPLVVDDAGRTRCYSHFYRERNGPSIVNAYALGDVDRLTPKQRQVMDCLLHEWPLLRITEHLRITPKTLEKHIAAILAITGQPHVGALLENCAHSD